MNATAKPPMYQLSGAYGISAEYDGDKLIIRVDRARRRELRRLRRGKDTKDDFNSDRMLQEFLEPLLGNSELEWIDASETGDLTSAPILGIFGSEQTSDKGPYGVRHVGRWPERMGKPVDWYQPIQFRWGYAPYQVRSPLTDLADDGEVTFRSHW